MTTRFHALLEKKIEEEIENRAASLASGAAADYPHYRESVGYINGLRDSIKLCDDVEQDLGNERGDIV
jgi:hypothetical protein